jgi:RNA-binding protein
MPISSKQRAELRAEAHHLDPQVHVGHQGVTDTLVQSLEDALRTHELVKVALNRTVESKPKELAGELASRVGADVVQVIGKTATLYRRNPELKHKDGVPPWRR